MKVIYKGLGSHAYHSAPSGTAYMFFAGVPLEVKPEDEDFFKRKASNPKNPWEVQTLTDAVLKNTAGAVVDAVRFGKYGAKKPKGKGVDE